MNNKFQLFGHFMYHERCGRSSALACCLALFLAVSIICVPALAFAYGTPANPGYVGLWEYPTAEMPADGTGRFGYTDASPYFFYYLDLAWLPWLEVNARLTTFDNVFVASNGKINVDGTGRDYMDKAIDVKLMLHHSDGGIFPSFAMGVTDIMGTEIMKAWYGVATWRMKSLALSLGYGTDRMNGVFGGVSWRANEWLTLKAEYGQLDYKSDIVSGFRPHPKEPDAKYNLGVVLSAPWGTEGSLSWQRGDKIVFSISQAFDMKGPYLFGSKKKEYDAPGKPRTAQWRDIDPEKLGEEIIEALSEFVRVRDIEVAISDKKVYVAYENYGHSSQADAMVRILVVMAAVLPHVDSMHLIPRVRGVPIAEAEFPGETLFDVRARNIEAEQFVRNAVFTWADKNFFQNQQEEWLYHSDGNLRKRARHDAKAMLVYEPRIDQTLDDDYQNRWSVDFIYENRSSNGWGAFADVRVPIYNNVDIWWEPDMNDDPRLQQMVLSYLGRIERGSASPLWSLSEAGWVDENWFGFSQWGRIYEKSGRWWMGGRLGLFRDRNPESFAGLADGQVDYRLGSWRDDDEDPWRSFALAGVGYRIPDLDLDFQVDYGRFLDGDTGGKLSVTRRWDDSAVGFWISKTDNLTSGKDFSNAGFLLELPAEKWFGNWFGNPSAHIWEQSASLLSTWRIDAAREPGAWKTPDHMLSQLRPSVLKDNVVELLADYCAYEEDSKDTQKIQGLTDYYLKK